MSHRRTPADRAARRETFLDAAAEVVRRDGAGASMEAMAAEAGVTKPILYRVFGDRRGLILALGERFAGEIDRAVTDAVSPVVDGGQLPEDPKAVLRAGIDSFLALIDREPELYRFVTERLVGDPDRPVSGFVDQLARRISVTLGGLLRAAGADSGAAEPWAYALVGSVRQVGDWWIERRTLSREALVDYLMAVIWDGVGDLAARIPSPGGPTRA